MSVQLDWIPRIEDFATRLVLIRHEMGWNLKEAALACDIRAQSWREWELEHRKPRDYEQICRKISERSGCNFVWLMTGYRPTPPQGGTTGSLLPRMDSNHQPSDLHHLIRLPAATKTVPLERAA
jgi:hypothetical protein